MLTAETKKDKSKINIAYISIPEEMKKYDQWVVWQSVQKEPGKKPTKIPYDAKKTTSCASVSNPSTFSSFNQAVETFENSGGKFSGIGFVLTENDPFVFIDLDAIDYEENDSVEIIEKKTKAKHLQEQILKNVNTYTELSPSGKGYHIVGIGKIPNGQKGKKRNSIEIYDKSRYMTVTGHIYGQKAIISDIQEDTEKIYSRIELNDNEPAKELTDFPSLPNSTLSKSSGMTDSDLMAIASSAQNGRKFEDLYYGNWEAYHQSQSEADAALMAIICYYTSDNEQAIRIFRSSALGQRDKAKRDDYMQFTLEAALKVSGPPAKIDISMISRFNDIPIKDQPIKTEKLSYEKLSLEGKLDAATENAAFKEWEKIGPYHVPPGLCGELMKLAYSRQFRQLPEAAFISGVLAISSIAGRAYNIYSKGLNMYICLLAPSGFGKEAIVEEFSTLTNHAKLYSNGRVNLEKISAGKMASEAALYRELNERATFTAFIGEFGRVIKTMTGRRSNSNEEMLATAYIDLYEKSGKSAILNKRHYSDKTKNTEKVKAPCLSIFTETNQHTFYQNLTNDFIEGGFMPRFFFLRCSANLRSKTNKKIARGEEIPTPEHILEKIERLYTHSAVIQKRTAHDENSPLQVLEIALTDSALEFSELVDEITTLLMPANGNQVEVALWNRVHSKMLKLAAIAAVGCDFENPVITKELMEWAFYYASLDVKQMIKDYRDGLIGETTNEVRQISDAKKLLKEFITLPYSSNLRRAYGISKDMHKIKVVTARFIKNRLLSIKSFNQDKKATFAVKNVITHLIETDYIERVPKGEMMKHFNTKAEAYMIVDDFECDDLEEDNEYAE